MSAHDETNGASTSKYMIGFVLAVILTLLSFIPVMQGMLNEWAVSAKVLYLVGMAVIQIVVQIVFFLHLNHGPDAKWNVATMWFGAVCVVIIIGGSWCAMSYLNYNMMGGSGRVERVEQVSAPAAQTAPAATAPASEEAAPSEATPAAPEDAAPQEGATDVGNGGAN